MTQLQSHLQEYSRRVDQREASGLDTEHTHRSALEALLELLGPQIMALNDPRHEGGMAPDFRLVKTIRGNLYGLGYVETKRLNESLDAIYRDSRLNSPRTRNGQQLKRYCKLDNLVLTNYREFYWFLNGELARKAKLDEGADDSAGVESLLLAFAQHQAEPVRSPALLAERMARITQVIKDVVVEGYASNEESTLLHDLRTSFKTLLIPDLTTTEFADMFAQSLAYGLFAARLRHKGPEPFVRRDAAFELPASNEFLKTLIGLITGPQLDSEPCAPFVEDMVHLLDNTDMERVFAGFGKHTGRRDPMFHFYETFLGVYDMGEKKKRGVYYTPEPVVDFIVRSVDTLLRKELKVRDGLADTTMSGHTYVDNAGVVQRYRKVLILDPACGTGTFLYGVIDFIRQQFMRVDNAGRWRSYVRDSLLHRLYGFEIQVAPYVVAHLKIGMELSGLGMTKPEAQTWGYDLAPKERLNIFLTNSLDPGAVAATQPFSSFISTEANAALRVKRDMPVMVVIGNPPYSGHSQNPSVIEVAATGRRKGSRKVRTWIGEQIQDYFKVDGEPLNEANTKWLHNDYVKFIRFGQRKIDETGQGVLGFITDSSYIEAPTFRGMRASLARSFDKIIILDLHGNTKERDRDDQGEVDESVFPITQGTAVLLAVKTGSPKKGPAKVLRASLRGRRAAKLDWLERNSVASVEWTEVTPRPPAYSYSADSETPEALEYATFPLLTEFFNASSLGCLTKRDSLTVAFTDGELIHRMAAFLSRNKTDDQVAADFGLPLEDKDKWDLRAVRKALGDSPDPSFVSSYLYRPFDARRLYYDARVVARPNTRVLSQLDGSDENLALLVGRQGAATGGQAWDVVFATRMKPDQNVFRRGGATVFPLWVGSEAPPGLHSGQGSFSVGRTLNLNRVTIDGFLPAGVRFSSDGSALPDVCGPTDIVAWIYAVLNSAAYRSRYATALRHEFPRIIPPRDKDEFVAGCAFGHKLLALHCQDERLAATVSFPVVGDDSVEKGAPHYVPPQSDLPGGGTASEGRVYIGMLARPDAQYFSGVSEGAWAMQVGGVQVVESWIKARQGRTLTGDDLEAFEQLVAAIEHGIELAQQCDAVVGARWAERGGDASGQGR